MSRDVRRVRQSVAGRAPDTGVSSLRPRHAGSDKGRRRLQQETAY